MAIPKISLKMRKGDSQSESKLSLSKGTRLEISTNDVSSISLGADYTKEDALLLIITGKVDLKVIGADGVQLSGELKHALLHGTNSFAGELELEIDKSISAALSTKFTPTEKTVGGVITLTF